MIPPTEREVEKELQKALIYVTGFSEQDYPIWNDPITDNDLYKCQLQDSDFLVDDQLQRHYIQRALIFDAHNGQIVLDVYYTHDPFLIDGRGKFGREFENHIDLYRLDYGAAKSLRNYFFEHKNVKLDLHFKFL